MPHPSRFSSTLPRSPRSHTSDRQATDNRPLEKSNHFRRCQCCHLSTPLLPFELRLTYVLSNSPPSLFTSYFSAPTTRVSEAGHTLEALSRANKPTLGPPLSPSTQRIEFRLLRRTHPALALLLTLAKENTSAHATGRFFLSLISYHFCHY